MHCIALALAAFVLNFLDASVLSLRNLLKYTVYYLRQVNEVNGEDTVFVRCVSVCVPVSARSGTGQPRPV